MADASAFDDVALLGQSRRSKRDPYRLGLFAEHLGPRERGVVLLAVQGGTLVVTDRRILEFRAHLDEHGAWNVKQFRGYEVSRQLDLGDVRGMKHEVRDAPGGTSAVEDVLTLVLAERNVAIVVSRGPEPTLSSQDFAALQISILGQPK